MCVGCVAASGPSRLDGLPPHSSSFLNPAGPLGQCPGLFLFFEHTARVCVCVRLCVCVHACFKFKNKLKSPFCLNYVDCPNITILVD